MTHAIIQAIPLLAVVALGAIAFTAALKDDGTIVCRARRGAETNTIVCSPRRDDGYGNHHSVQRPKTKSGWPLPECGSHYCGE
jgi:hypothetical protein